MNADLSIPALFSYSRVQDMLIEYISLLRLRFLALCRDDQSQDAMVHYKCIMDEMSEEYEPIEELGLHDLFIYGHSLVHQCHMIMQPDDSVLSSQEELVGLHHALKTCERWDKVARAARHPILISLPWDIEYKLWVHHAELVKQQFLRFNWQPEANNYER